MTTKVESYCASKRMRQVVVDAAERACINCIWYEQYYRRNRGNLGGWVPACAGWCLRQDKAKGPLARPCREYEREERP